ncbi:MAG TPA: peptidoglycan-binding protein [Candidatus Nanoarchaeia archaeon]|nr:peptidoglycan-binding protein [Candidatus Nanoarchaeia archaeon]
MKIKLVFTFLILIVCLGLVSANIIASLGTQGLSFIDPSAGQAVNSIVNAAFCVSNPAGCATQKIVSVVSQTLLNQISQGNPSLGKIINFYNKIKPLVDSGDAEIKEEVKFNEDGTIESGIVSLKDNVELDISSFFDNDNLNFLAKNIDIEKTDNGVSILSFNKENGAFSIIEKSSGKKINFENIVPSNEGDSYISIDKFGSIFSAGFLVNENGGVYNFNDNIINAPANTKVKYLKGVIARPSKIDMELSEGATLEENPLISNGLVEIKGKDVKLPDGNVLNEGSLFYNKEGVYVAKGYKTRINRVVIDSYGEDTCLYKCEGNFVFFDHDKKSVLINGQGFRYISSLGVSSDIKELSYPVSLPLGREDYRWVNNYFGVSSNVESYSQDTKKQILKFQKENNLAIDGIIGPETLSTMYGFPKLDILDKGYFDSNNIPLEIKNMLNIQNTYDGKQIDSLIKNYQKSKGLKQDGLIGVNTLVKLREDFLSGKTHNFYPDNVVVQPQGALVEFSNSVHGINFNHISGNGDVILGNWKYNYMVVNNIAIFEQEIFPLSENKGYIPANFLFNNEKEISVYGNLYGGIKSIEVDKHVIQRTIEQAYKSKYYKTPSRCGANFRCVMQGVYNLEDNDLEQLFGSTRGFDARKLPSKIRDNGGVEVDFNALEPGDVMFFEGNSHVAAVTKVIYDNNGKVVDIEFTHQFANANAGKMQQDTFSKFSKKYPDYKPNQYMRLNWNKIGGKPDDNLLTLENYDLESVYAGELSDFILNSNL